MREDGSVIVTGVPGAGKSSIARALAERAKLAAHLELDGIYEMVRGGRIHFRSDSPAEDWWQLDLAREQICTLANSYAAHGVWPVVDDVLASRSVLNAYTAGLPGPVRLVVLAPSLEVVRARDAARHKQVADHWIYLAEPMADEFGDVGLWIDTTDLDINATLAVIDERWDEALT